MSRPRSSPGRSRWCVAEKDGGLVIGTNRDELSRENPEVGFETELILELPPGTRLSLENEHGAVEVHDVAEATIVNAFDSLKVERVAGRADLKQRHGDLEVNEIGGALSVVGRHGDVTVRGVAGPSRLDVEHGNVKVEGSAGLEVKLAHGSLDVKTIGGDLKIEAEHSEVSARNVTGAARVATTFDSLTVEGVGGRRDPARRARARDGPGREGQRSPSTRASTGSPSRVSGARQR